MHHSELEQAILYLEEWKIAICQEVFIDLIDRLYEPAATSKDNGFFIHYEPLFK